VDGPSTLGQPSVSRASVADVDWKPALVHALERGDRAALARIPKTDLHCHALLSAPIETYAAVVGELPPVPRRFGSFQAFAGWVAAHLLPALPDPKVVRRVLRAALDRMVADGVVYAEMSFDLIAPDFLQMPVEEFAAMVGEEGARVAPRLRLAPEIGISRGLPPEQAMPRLRAWIATGVFRSVDLYDDENLGRLEDFVPLYRLAGEHGLRLKAHAGEMCGPEGVRRAVELLGLHAVQHGVRAVEDPSVVDFLAERRTVLHVCPTSNWSLGVCETLEGHPAPRLAAAGVRLTANSDDFTLFGAEVSDELVNLVRMGIAPAEVARMVETGLRDIPD
jgi:adenosine deaminase